MFEALNLVKNEKNIEFIERDLYIHNHSLLDEIKRKEATIRDLKEKNTALQRDNDKMYLMYCRMEDKYTNVLEKYKRSLKNNIDKKGTDILFNVEEQYVNIGKI